LLKPEALQGRVHIFLLDFLIQVQLGADELPQHLIHRFVELLPLGLVGVVDLHNAGEVWGFLHLLLNSFQVEAVVFREVGPIQFVEAGDDVLQGVGFFLGEAAAARFSGIGAGEFSRLMPQGNAASVGFLNAEGVELDGVEPGE